MRSVNKGCKGAVGKVASVPSSHDILADGQTAQDRTLTLVHMSLLPTSVGRWPRTYMPCLALHNGGDRRQTQQRLSESDREVG